MTDSYFVLVVAFSPRNDVTSSKSCDLGHTLKIIKGNHNKLYFMSKRNK